MDRERWDRMQALFHGASQLPLDEQAAFLRNECGRDSELVREVESMLAADRDAESLLDHSLSEAARNTFSDDGDRTAQEFGPYRIEKLLGEGGMGSVWLAERRDTRQCVAIKFLPHATLSPFRRQRFAREIRTLAKLKHPYIARFFDAGTLDDGTPWFVMEYVDGVPLTEYASTLQSREQKLDLFRKICEAVLYAHGQEIIHRDLKPTNILVEKDGTPRLLDFGIARELHRSDEISEVTRPELRFVSPHYAAPEWVRDGAVGLHTDVYSLGVILYEILTGCLPAEPVRNPSMLARLGSKATERDLDALCLKAIRCEPSQRYASVEALLREVMHLRSGEPLEARRPTFCYRAAQFMRRNRRAVLSVAAVLLLIAVLSGFYTSQLAHERNLALAAAKRTRRIQRFMLDLFGAGDQSARPANDLRVATLLDRGVESAHLLGDDPETQGELYQTLGTEYQLLGRFKKADALIAEGLLEIEHAPGHDSREEADALVQLGILRGDEARAKEGEQLVDQGLAIARHTLPDGDPVLLGAELGLGRVLLQSGGYERTIHVLQPLTTRTPGDEQTALIIAQSLSASAIAQQYLGHYDQASALNRRALVLDRKFFGDYHPRIAEDLANLATTELTIGKPAAAEPLYRRAAAILERWYGPDHPETAQVLSFVAISLIEQRKDANAEPLLKRVLVILEQAYGERHPSVALTLETLGKVARRRGDLAAAETYFGRALDIQTALLGERNFNTAVVRANLGATLVDEKKFAEAEPVLRNAAAVLTPEKYPNNRNAGIVRVVFARMLLAEKRYGEAEAPLLTARSILAANVKANAPYIAEIRHDLARFYPAKPKY